METKQTTQAPPAYQNNPFMIAVDGLNLLFKLAQSVAIFGIILCVLSLGGSYGGPSGDSASSDADSVADTLGAIPAEVWIIIGVIILIVVIGMFVIGVIISGIMDYTAAKLAQNKTVTLGEAFSGTMKNFGGYLWVRVIVAVKTFLWSLLLIIPGIVMAYRYSLAGVAFFADEKKGDAAVAHSLSLTRGAWLTTYASQTLFNLVTFGLVSSLLMPGTNGLLYRQYTALGDTPKPAAHGLSWLALFIPIVLLILAGLLLALLIYVLSSGGTAPTGSGAKLT